MANLAIHIPIFVASPNDVAAERNIVHKEILDLQQEVYDKGLLLNTFRWEVDAMPTAQPPQQFVDKYLVGSELTIVIFGSKLGSDISLGNEKTGSEHEFRIATDNVVAGISDDVFLYFKTQGINEYGQDIDRLNKFKNDIKKEGQILFWEYQSAVDFEVLLRKHLRKWIRKWMSITQICSYTLKNSTSEAINFKYRGDDKLTDLRRFFNPIFNLNISEKLGIKAVELYQTFGASGVDCPFNIGNEDGLKDYINSINDLRRPLNNTKNNLVFSQPEWFFFFCAYGLQIEILRKNEDAVSKYPYINPVHQYLKILINPNNKLYEETLSDWLLNRSGRTYDKPIARNFAAYTLGMIGAKSCEDALAKAAKEDKGQDVRLYSIMSLGKLRSRKHLGLLIEIWENTTDQNLKLYIGQCICNIINLTNYEF